MGVIESQRERQGESQREPVRARGNQSELETTRKSYNKPDWVKESSQAATMRGRLSFVATRWNKVFLAKIVKIRAKSWKKWLKVRWEPTPQFMPLWSRQQRNIVQLCQGGKRWTLLSKMRKCWPYVMWSNRVAELGSLLSGAKMAMKIFVKRVFTIFASNASFLRVIANLQN